MDEAVAVADRSTLNEVERRRLLQVLSDLTSEGRDETQAQSGQAFVEERPLHTMLDQEDEQLVTELRAGLKRLTGLPPEEPVECPAAVQGALDGAEFVVRGDILFGEGARLRKLLPSFVFLVLLPVRGKPEAQSIAERAALLLEAEEETD